MTKIKNNNAFPFKKPVANDYVPGTDTESNGDTVSFNFSDIASLINAINGNESINYTFALSSVGELDENGNGYFLSENNQINPLTVTKLIFSKKTKSNTDLSNIFNFLGQHTDSFIFKIKNSSDPNNFLYLEVSSITEEQYQFTFSVSIYSNDIYLGNLQSLQNYNISFEIKSNSGVSFIKSDEDLSLASRKGDILYGILDRYTGEEIILNKVTGTPIIDNIIYFQLGSEYFKRYYTYNVNVKWFGAKGDRLTDDSSSIQNAINYVFSVGGGEVYFPNGVYLISNPLITSLNSVNPNCQIYIPLKTEANIGTCNVIKLKGETSVNYNTSGLTSWNKTYDGVVLLSTITGSGVNPSVIGSPWGISTFGNFNFTQLEIENIRVRVKTKNGATNIAPTVGGINAGNLELFSAENLHIDIETPNYDSVLPSVDVTGLITPYINNNAWTYLNRVSVEGMNKGIRVSEHTNGNNVTVWNCVHGLYMMSSFHLSSFDHLLIAWCNNNITAPNDLFPSPVLKINNLTIESYNNSNGAKWYLSAYDINDAGNLLKGEVKYVRIVTNIGVDKKLINSGALNLNCYNLVRQGEKKTVLGSQADVSTGTGLGVSGLTVLEVNGDNPSSDNVNFTDIRLTHTQNGSDHIVGRIPFINLASTNTDKRIAQIYATTNGAVEKGKIYVNLHDGTSLKDVAIITSNYFKLETVIRLKAFTVSTLPSGVEGDKAYVTDAVSPTYLGPLTGGGSIKCPVFYNGVSWVSC